MSQPDGPLRPVSRACLDGQHDQCPGVNSAGATCTCEHHQPDAARPDDTRPVAARPDATEPRKDTS